MEDETFHARSFRPTVIQDVVVYMEPEAIVPTDENEQIKEEKKPSPPTSTNVEVCYPYALQSSDPHSTIEIIALNAYLQKRPRPETVQVDEENEPIFKMERQLTAKLDDLLENIEKKPSPSRRFSMYGENIKDPSSIDKGIDRYTFYSAELGSIKGHSFRDLLNTKATSLPEEKGINKSVAELLLETACWWIDILAPTNEEMRTISKIFKIHPLTTEDIQAQESREKCEIFQNYMFISFRSFNHDFHSPSYLEAANFYIVVYREGVLTFRFQDLPHPHNVRRRIHQLKDFIRVTPEWINYALIDNITDSFAPLIQHTELEVDSIDDLVLVLNGSEQNDMLRRIGSCRKTVMQLLRLLGPKADVVRSLIKRYDDKAKEISYHLTQQRKTSPTQNIILNSGEIISEKEEIKAHHEVTLYLGDIQDHILTMLQNVNHYDLILGRAHRNYLGQISIELSQAGNTTNEVINRLTFFATIIVPLNLVGGLFGMNVKVPGDENTDLVWFFWIVMGMLIYVVAMVAVGKRTGFL
ncbi:MAG: hypothetical protein EXX96DRAFT_565960 [Benjaminiella poitrasii]|nr:MAG: hypothetical protein EXX96DRAFT_565960 [Benjaminiella poitrasii]